MKKYKLFSLFIMVFWLILLGLIFRVVFPLPNQINYKQKNNIFTLIPQGWGFFTRNPREESIIIYKISNNKVKNITYSNSSFNNYLGFSRNNRLKAVELASILTKIKKTSWKKEKGIIFNLDLKIISDTMENTFYPKSYKGEFFIVKQERIPWAWSKNYSSIIMPYKYAKIFIE